MVDSSSWQHASGQWGFSFWSASLGLSFAHLGSNFQHRVLFKPSFRSNKKCSGGLSSSLRSAWWPTDDAYPFWTLLPSFYPRRWGLWSWVRPKNIVLINNVIESLARRQISRRRIVTMKIRGRKSVLGKLIIKFSEHVQVKLWRQWNEFLRYFFEVFCRQKWHQREIL